MKKLLLALTLYLGLVIAPLPSMAADDPVVPEAVSAAVESTPAPAIEAALSTEASSTENVAVGPVGAEQPASEDGASWSIVIRRTIIDWILPLGALLITGLLVPKLLKKLKMSGNKELEALLGTLVKKMVNWVESLAISKLKNTGEGLGSASKKALAVDAILSKAEEYGINDLARDYVEKLVDAQVARDNTLAGK